MSSDKEERQLPTNVLQQSMSQNRLQMPAAASYGSMGGYGNRQQYQNNDYYNYDYPDYGGGNRGYGAYGQNTNSNMRNRQFLLGSSNQNNYGSGFGGSNQIDRSSYGSFSGGYNECDSGISIALLLISLAGIATMFYILYTKIQAGRKKRSSDETDLWWAFENIETIVYSGKLALAVIRPAGLGMPNKIELGSNDLLC